VEVSNNDQQYSHDGILVFFIAASTITSLVPSWCPESGGQTIIVKGAHFTKSNPNLIQCRFGTVLETGRF
jgi:hypothetical protein